MTHGSTTAVVYLAAVYPHARGVKWVRSLLDAGLTPVVVYGRGREELWDEQNGVRTFWEPVLRRKIHPAPARAANRIAAGLAEKHSVPAAILVRDVFLAPLAEQLAKQFRCPWVLDLCDNYPEVARQLSTWQRPWRWLGAYFIQRLESAAVREAAATIFVSPESRRLVLGKVGARLGVGESPAFVVENAPWYDERMVIPPTSGRGTGLVYIGTVDSNIRDFGTVVRGLELYRQRNGEHVWVDLFTFDRSKAERELTRSEPMWREYVRILDPVPASELGDRMKGYLAGLVPHHAGPAVDYTISNKIFDYLYAGLPVLASDNPPNVRLLSRVGGGLTYRRESPESFAERVARLQSAPELLAASDTAVLKSEFTWQSQVAEFIAFLRKRLDAGSVTSRMIA